MKYTLPILTIIIFLLGLDLIPQDITPNLNGDAAFRGNDHHMRSGTVYVRPEGKGLAELARLRNKYFGANFSSPYWGWNWQSKPVSDRSSVYAAEAGGNHAGYEEIAVDHFNILCGGNDCFWIQDDPARVANGSYDYGSADALIDFMEANDIAFHYHGLGYIQRGKFTKWRQGRSRAEIRKVYEQYVRNVSRHFKGRVSFYDVINEHAGYKASFRGEPYYNSKHSHKQYTDLNMFGHLYAYLHPDEGEVYALEYYMRTLGIANCMDSDARLVYLDYNNEIIGSKANVMYRTSKALLDRGVPPHGFGTQLHTSTSFS